jgi:hypothetical protein
MTDLLNQTKEKKHYKFYRRGTQNYYMNDYDKTEALVTFASLPDIYVDRKGSIPDEINDLLNKFYSWKNDYYYHIKTESLSGTVLVLLCITFGSGILSLPYTIKSVGIILGVILFILSSLICFWTLKLLTHLAYKKNVLDYCQLVEIYFDHQTVILTEVINLISNLATIIVYQQFSNYHLTKSLIL